MVQDPLVLDPTPWALLELPPNLMESLREQIPDDAAGDGRAGRIERDFRTAVDRAYTRALRNRVPPQKAKIARDTLLRPTGRARADLLRFSDDAFARLAGASGVAVLDPLVRSATARAWEAHFAVHIEDLWAAHSLAVLWWGWVHWEEQRLQILATAGGPRASLNRQIPLDKFQLLEVAHKASGGVLTGLESRCCSRDDCPWLGDFQSSAPDLFTMWCALIGYVGLLSTERAFVAQRFGLAQHEAETVLDSLVETLKVELLDRAQTLGSSVEAQRYRLLEQFLVQEVHTARVLGAARLSLGGVERALGPRLLARLGLTEVADDARRRQAAQGHGPAVAAALKVSLSPYATLERQAHDGKPELALEAMALMPAHEQAAPALERARAVALSIIALNLVSLGRLDQALATWGRAAPGALAQDVQAQIVRLVTDRFAVLSNSQRERDALDLLLEALKVLPGSTALQGLISTERYNLTIRALQRIRGKVDRGRSDLNDMRTLSELIEQLEPMLALGIEEARTHLEWAHATMETHSIGGQSNRLARVRLDHELLRWCDRTRRKKLQVSLQELLSEFQMAGRLGSRKARANAETVTRLLHRMSAPPEELPALVLADFTRLEEERAPYGPATSDIPRLEGLHFDLEASLAAAHPEAIALAAKIVPILVDLLLARAKGALELGLVQPLRDAGGLRLVTATGELKALLAAYEDLKRAIALHPAHPTVAPLLADVRECLDRANKSRPVPPDARATLQAQIVLSPVTLVVIVGAMIMFFYWLIRSLLKELRPVH